MLLELVSAASLGAVERGNRVELVTLLAEPLQLALHHKGIGLAVIIANFAAQVETLKLCQVGLAIRELAPNDLRRGRLLS
jgi:hypothetical protein